MADCKYCYPNSDVLINKLDIRDYLTLKKSEIEYTYYRVLALQQKPINGKFDFNHFKKIHKYIFQDIYSWAGKIRTVDITKGNSYFCPSQHIDENAKKIFANYYSDCKNNATDRNQFIDTFTEYYADVNALHPFREGNGRTQREFARCVCLNCGYIFDLSTTTHKQMLEASISSMTKTDKLKEIFSKKIIPIGEYEDVNPDKLKILSIDDLILGINDDSTYDTHYVEFDSKLAQQYIEIYKERFQKI